MSDETTLQPGALALDSGRNRVGVVMCSEGLYVQLRPLGGGREWDAKPELVRSLTARDELHVAQSHEALGAKGDPARDAGTRGAGDVLGARLKTPPGSGDDTVAGRLHHRGGIDLACLAREQRREVKSPR